MSFQKNPNTVKTSNNAKIVYFRKFGRFPRGTRTWAFLLLSKEFTVDFSLGRPATFTESEAAAVAHARKIGAKLVQVVTP